MGICYKCKVAADHNKQALHALCKGGTHCMCQHRPTIYTWFEIAPVAEEGTK